VEENICCAIKNSDLNVPKEKRVFLTYPAPGLCPCTLEELEERPPRQIYRELTDQVDISAPRDKEEQKKGAFLKILIPPLLSAGMTVAFGVLMGRGIMMLMSAGMMVVTLVNSVFTFFQTAKKNAQRTRSA